MPPAIPIATYRLQLTADFNFEAAAAVVPYLKALGITHLYASPFLKARKGSTHGYDIVDHTKFNPEPTTGARSTLPRAPVCWIRWRHRTGIGWRRIGRAAT